MVKIVSSKDVVAIRTVSKGSGNTYEKAEYFSGGPQANLMDFPEPGGTIEPHFHRVNQFQIVVRGTASVGKREVRGFAFHYADAFSPYGPLVGGDEGFAFMTVRATPDHSGAHWMPGSKDEMERKARRNIACQIDLKPQASDGEQLEWIIEPDSDGLAASVVRSGPGSSLTLPDGANGGGQYCMVLDGLVAHEEQELPEVSCLWVPVGDRAPRLTAGPTGAAVLVLQFPQGS